MSTIASGGGGAAYTGIQVNKSFGMNVIPMNRLSQPQRLAGSVFDNQSKQLLQSGIAFTALTGANKNDMTIAAAFNSNQNTAKVDHTSSNLDQNVKQLNDKIKIEFMRDDSGGMVA